MERRNVLSVVLDAVRKDHPSTYGYDRPTSPELAAFTDGARAYEAAFAPGVDPDDACRKPEGCTCGAESRLSDPGYID